MKNNNIFEILLKPYFNNNYIYVGYLIIFILFCIPPLFFDWLINDVHQKIYYAYGYIVWSIPAFWTASKNLEKTQQTNIDYFNEFAKMCLTIFLMLIVTWLMDLTLIAAN